MMSSFRPDPGREVEGFVADPIAGISAVQGGEDLDSKAAVASPESKPAPAARIHGPQNSTQEQIEALEAAAFERGAESNRESAEQLARVCQALEASATQLQRSSAQALSVNRERMLSLALEIARRWVGEYFSAEPARFARALDRALVSCRENDPERLFLNPGDYAALVANQGERIEAWRRDGVLELIEDETLQTSEFRIEARSGLLDARGAVICERLREAMNELVEAGDGELSS